MERKLQVTDYLAFYGAFLSTVVFLWNIQNSRPKIKVEIVYGDDNSEFGVWISVMNPSATTAHVAEITLITQYERTSVFDKIGAVIKYRNLDTYPGWVYHPSALHGIETGFPRAIEPHNAHQFFVPETAVKKMLDGETRFAAVAQDALCRNKFSNVFSLYHPDR